MRVRCLGCGRLATTAYLCKLCGRQNGPPTGKRYKHVVTHSEGTQTIFLDEGEELCPTCSGAGRWDSCFDCGNRGHTLAPPEHWYVTSYDTGDDADYVVYRTEDAAVALAETWAGAFPPLGRICITKIAGSHPIHEVDWSFWDLTAADALDVKTWAPE